MSKKRPDDSEQEPTPSRSGPCPVVGIGASAGGVEALKQFFSSVDPQSDMAYVVVQHLDPEHESLLSQLLGRASPLPFSVVENDTRIVADHVYVIPPNAVLTIENGRLRLSRPAEPRGQRSPIDQFFISLAGDQGENAACIILSGTGSDGTLGLRAVKEHGGLVLAQANAEYDGMMRSALGTGLVDFVLPADEMAAKIADYFRHRADGATKPPETSSELSQVYALLRARTGHDFSGYKDKTIIRRVQRRMQVLQLSELQEFLVRLRKEPREIDLLLQDLLIGVTSFFRDREAYEALEAQAIPKLFEGKGADDAVRVWVPGCATGEEAYSIAILLREHAPKSQAAPKLQIFASDIDDVALDIGRTGRFPAASLKDIPANRLERYFVREDGTYRVAPDLREICLFSLHNLLRDAPFSRLDMISCRNLLIYLNHELQSRVIQLFHYALRDNGILFLGTSENVSRHTRLFATVDKPSRIFRRRPQADRRLPEFPLTAPDLGRRKLVPVVRPVPAETSLQGVAERELLEQYAPAHVVINGDGDVLHASARTGKYLELPAGTPDHSIFSMARRGLRLEMRAAVHKAMSNGRTVVQKNVAVGTNGGRQAIDLIVQPLRSGDHQDALYLVVFQDIGGIQQSSDQDAAATEEVESTNLRQLEEELRATRERLQTMTEELESSNEELKSGNEELSSMNEELQSANEELETSREELQSINEELQTVNAELHARVEELSRANSDMANLLESTQIATLFLDRNLMVKSFTPAAKDVFRLVESDTGRPISHVRARFASDTVQDDAERVLRTLATIEKQVENGDTGYRYIMRIMPYRTLDNVINGVVITFTDITQISAAEERISELTRDLRNRLDSLETLLDLVPVGILFLEGSDPQVPIRLNRYGARLLGGPEGEKGLRQTTAPVRLLAEGIELAADDQPLMRAIHSGKPIPSFEGTLVRPDGGRIDVMMSATPLFDESGKVRGAIASITDITERKKGETHQQMLLHELQHRVKNSLANIIALTRLMMKPDQSAEGFADALRARLMAMGRMHDLLAQRNWQGAPLDDLVGSALMPYVAPEMRNVERHGPEVMLKPNAAATLGMVLHELATNAVKYGALSSPDGRVEVAWEVDGARGSGKEATFSLRWTEQDGPSVRVPVDNGFGSSFVRRSVEYELNGTASLEFEPKGLRCTFTIPLRNNVDRYAERERRDDGGEG